MDNSIRAEKIIRFVKTAKDEYLYADDSCLDFVSSQLDEAVREAKNKCDHDSPCCDTCIDKFRAQGFSDAREMAIEICDPCGYTDCKHDRCGIAERIRALTPDEGIRQKEE